jgi:hypothetical protein
VRCKAAKETLAFARLERAKARLHEMTESKKALYELGRWNKSIFDWGNLRKASKDVRCWEARCEGAEVALRRCEEKYKKVISKSRRLPKHWMPSFHALVLRRREERRKDISHTSEPFK